MVSLLCSLVYVLYSTMYRLAAQCIYAFYSAYFTNTIQFQTNFTKNHNYSPLFSSNPLAPPRSLSRARTRTVINQHNDHRALLDGRIGNHLQHATGRRSAHMLHHIPPAVIDAHQLLACSHVVQDADEGFRPAGFRGWDVDAVGRDKGAGEVRDDRGCGRFAIACRCCCRR